MYTFNNDRFVTRGIADNIPVAIQISLWQTIDKLVNSDVTTDYLQVFKLINTNNGTSVLKVIHSQEVPPYTNEYVIQDCKLDSDFKIYVIDDSTHSTMLLSDEY